MALVCAHISDQEVLRDYKAVLAPGAAIVGPAAVELRNGTLPDAAIDWLKTNFLKTSWSWAAACAPRQRGRASATFT